VISFILRAGDAHGATGCFCGEMISGAMTVEEANAASVTAEAVAHRSRARLVAFLAAQSHDVAAAEDALQGAFESALMAWPEQGCPANPEAWLLTVARRKLIDRMRRDRDSGDPEELERLAAVEDDGQEEIPDRRLALLFACGHPAIDAAIRAPLMLQVVLGLEAAQIASAFLMSPAAMAQRLVRAKTKIRHAGIPFRIPERSELAERLEGVLNAVYACFTEGWIDPAGTDEARRELAGEAIYLGRMLAELLPEEPEAWGLLALMLYAEARRPARRNADGEFVPLSEQQTALWNAAMIEEAEAALKRASALGRIGRFQLEAAIQSAHVERRRTASVEWNAIMELYDALVKLTGSPVAQINRAVALAEVEGAEAGLAELAEVEVDARVRSYQPYWAARAELLARRAAQNNTCAADHGEASQAYEIAIGMESDPAVRRYLEGKREQLR
jgi:RNA polymerase sigma-70 factor, ECF subfamily